MFSTKEHLKKKTGPYGVGRLSYLQLLVNEFQEVTDADSRHQILANLANFSYDPINYEYLRQLNVIELFLDCLTEADEKIVEFAIAGICNLCLDEKNKSHIFRNDGITLVIGLLLSGNENVLTHAITTLIYFANTSQLGRDVLNFELLQRMLKFQASANGILGNLATVFIEDNYTAEAINQVKASLGKTI